MSKAYKIGVIPGDGIGPEVVRQGLRVLEAVAPRAGFTYELTHYPYGGQYYLDTGELLPDAALDDFRRMDAMLMGAIGDPRVELGVLERGIIIKLRFALDLYVNLRPIQLYAEHLCPVKDKRPEDVDLVVVRENTEDAYSGIGGFLKRGTPDEVAIAEMIYTRKGVERVIRYGFELARKRQKKNKLTLVHKSNAIPAHSIWTRAFEEVAAEFPDVTTDQVLVDASTMWMVKNPEWFDVVVTTNLFGDIITDLGAIIQGGMGIATSGNIRPGEVSMFEPVHGSAPKYAGQNVANPLGAIAAVAMMLDYLGEQRAGRQIVDAIKHVLSTGKVRSLSADSGQSTTEVGDVVMRAIEER